METIQYSKIHKEKALERARRNLSTVTALADHLVRKFGISFSEAHGIVGSMVAKAVDEGSFIDGMRSLILKDASRSVLGKELEIGDEEIRRVLDPYENVESKKVIGGPSRGSVERMLSEANAYMDTEKAWLAGEVERVNQAYERIGREQETLSSR